MTQRDTPLFRALYRELHCPICLDFFTDPVIINDRCGHTFCKSCVRKLPKQKNLKIRCPLCNQEYRLPQNNVGKLNHNRYVESIIASLQQEGVIEGTTGLDKEEDCEVSQNYILPENQSVDFLSQVGVTTAETTPQSTGDIDDLYRGLGQYSSEVRIDYGDSSLNTNVYKHYNPYHNNPHDPYHHSSYNPYNH
eukprot:TRINITY_DN3527_c0_g1_i1.p1 TRINITY_DN3527_c0_g1~~TRINITY_DN3527_c0_g1_i1.p1  ORF type:complete len:193 (-),score=22.79 TRINITY_DN3527_c0_g1_i1:46-624(-)